MSRIPRWALIVFLCTMAVRVALALMGDCLAGDDGDRYLTEARNLLNSGVFSALNGAVRPTAHDMPGYAALLCVMLRLFGNWADHGAALLNCLFFAAAAFGVCHIAQELEIPPEYSLLAFCVFPESFTFAIFYMPDAAFMAFFVYALLAWLRRRLYLCAVLWAIACYFKPVGIPIGAGLLLIEFARSLMETGNRRRVHVVRACLAGLLAVAFLAPWALRNKAVFGSATLATVGDFNLYYRIYALTEHRTDIANLDPRAVDEEGNPVQITSANARLAKADILAHPARYAATFLRLHPRLYAGTSLAALYALTGQDTLAIKLKAVSANPLSLFRTAWHAVALQFFGWMVLIGLYASAAAGAVSELRRGNVTALFVCGGIVLCFALAIGPVVMTRYRFQMTPWLALLAGEGLRLIAFRFSASRRRSVYAPLQTFVPRCEAPVRQ